MSRAPGRHAPRIVSGSLAADGHARRRDHALGRRFVVHYKATLTLVFWQEGPLLAAVTASLPAERVVAAARVAVGGERP
jgi:hypothetical protein